MMSGLQVGGSQQLTQPGFQEVESETGPQALAGKAANGEKLVATTNTSSPLAKAADAMEEMSFAKSQFKDDLKDRKVSKDDDLSKKLRELIQKVQTIQNIQEIKDFHNQLKSSPNLTQQQLQRRLEEFSDDKLHQYAALDSAIDFFEELGDTEKADLVREMRDSFFEKNKTAIKSGLNVSQVAAELAEETGLSDTRGIREGYSKYLDHVEDHKSLYALFEHLVENGDSEQLDSAEPGSIGITSEDLEMEADIKLKLLATDLGCSDPTWEDARLQAVMQDMSKIKVLMGVLDSCVETEDQLRRMYFKTDG